MKEEKRIDKTSTTGMLENLFLSPEELKGFCDVDSAVFDNLYLNVELEKKVQVDENQLVEDTENFNFEPLTKQASRS